MVRKVSFETEKTMNRHVEIHLIFMMDVLILKILFKKNLSSVSKTKIPEVDAWHGGFRITCLYAAHF